MLYIYSFIRSTYFLKKKLYASQNVSDEYCNNKDISLQNLYKMALEAAPGGSSKNSESHLIKAEEKNPACCLLLMFKKLQPKVI